MHVAELRIAQWPAVARGHLDGVEHAGERDLLAVGHIGVPALSGVGEPNRLAGGRHVGQHHHFGKAGFVELIGDVDLELAEHAPEARKLLRLEPLLGKAQHAALAERPQDLLEVAVRTGWARSTPSILAPNVLPLGWTFMPLLASSVYVRARRLDDRRPLRQLRLDECGRLLR